MSIIKKKSYYNNLLQSDKTLSFITTKNISESELIKKENCTWPIHYMEQVHGNDFKIITNNSPKNIGEADGIITDQKNILLRVRVADCLPVLIYLPNQAVAAIHSGRASTEGNIVGRVLHYFKNNYASDKNPIIWLGPCICSNCYQINRELDLYYDMRGKVMEQIKKVYPQADILHLNSCTLEGTQWFSYRENKTTERMLAYIGMR